MESDPDAFMEALPACPGCGCRLSVLKYDVEDAGDGPQWDVTVDFHCGARVFSCRNSVEEPRRWYGATGCPHHFQAEALGTPVDD